MLAGPCSAPRALHRRGPIDANTALLLRRSPLLVALDKGLTVTGLSVQRCSPINEVVPAGSTNLRSRSPWFLRRGHVLKLGSAPTDTVYDCRPYRSGNAETCTFAAPAAGTYHVRMKAYSAFSGMSLVGNYTTGGGGGTSFFENLTDFTINDNATVDSPLVVSGRTGNAPSTLRVGVTILHTYKGDLRVDLVAPDAVVQPSTTVPAAVPTNISGTFTTQRVERSCERHMEVAVNDNAAGDFGRIDKWSPAVLIAPAVAIKPGTPALAGGFLSFSATGGCNRGNLHVALMATPCQDRP